MDIKLARSLWGVTDSWEAAFPRFHNVGYSAIECSLPEASQRSRFRALLAQHGFGYIAAIYTQGNTPQEHAASFAAQVDDALTMQPMLINCHSGRDAFTMDESAAFFEAALSIERAAGIDVAHETHRGRILYNPWITIQLIEQLPGLKLCADYSHWVCVAERLLMGCEAILAACAPRVIHIHGRVGYEEGPQVPDPRAPEYAQHVAAHEIWWKQIATAQAAAGRSFLTLTPEFGPPAYLHTLPHTNVPVANLSDICDWMARREASVLCLD